MKIVKSAAVILLGLGWNFALAQPVGEENELSPEELDAAFTAEDAAREKALISDQIIDYSDPVGRATDAADLVVQGRVTSQSYVYDAAGNPFTHTTVQVDSVLSGSHSADEITLVQEGGPSKDGEQVVLVSDVEYFNVGEEEVLFLGLDADNDHPAQQVTIRQRFRVFEGQVFTVDGRGIALFPSDSGQGHTLAISDDRHPAKRFSEIHIGDRTLTKNFGGKDEGDPDSSPGGETEARATAPGYESSVDIGTFSAAIAN